MFDRQTFLVWTGFDKQNGARGWKHFGASLTVEVNVTLKSFELMTQNLQKNPD